MNYRLALSTAILLLLALSTFAQVEITGTKKIYTRTGQNVPEHKKTFEVRYPLVSGLQSESVKRRLEETINYWNNFDITLEESLSDYTWLDLFDYTVNYNKNDLLDIGLIMEGSGAYPDGQVKTLVVDLRTGRRLRFNEVFTNIGELVLKIDKAQQAEIRQARLDAIKNGMDDAESIEELIGDRRFNVGKLEGFSISDKGVTFLYDYGFAHAVKALEPEGRYFFVWTDMRPHLRKDGRFSSFRR